MAIIGSNNSNPIQIGVRRNAVIEKNTGRQVGTGVDAPTTTRTMPKSSFGASIAKAFADLGTRFTKWRAELEAGQRRGAPDRPARRCQNRSGEPGQGPYQGCCQEIPAGDAGRHLQEVLRAVSG